MSESETFGRAVAVLREVGICRVRNIAKAMNSILTAISGTLVALITSFFPTLFINNMTLGSLMLVLALEVVEAIMYYTAKRSFKYTFGMAELAGEKIKDIQLMIFPIAMLIPLVIANYISIPQLVLASPFFGISILKFVSSKESIRKAGSITLLGLTMISTASPLLATPTTLSISTSISALVEGLMYIEEAEKCGDRSK